MSLTTETPETKPEGDNWFIVCQGYSTIHWKEYLRNTHGMHWDETEKIWVLGCLTEEAADELIRDIHRHTKRGRKSKAPFSIWKDQGGEWGSKDHPVAEPEYYEDWKAVAERARGFLLEGRETEVISRKEELGYMGAIAIIMDRKSRPSDKKAALDLILRLEGVFEERNKGIEEGDEAKGTQELLDKLNQADG